MKKFIHILSGLYVNLEAITAVDFTDGAQILIYIGNAEGPFIVEHNESYPDGMVQGPFQYVKIQELHRIKRELCKLLEIEESTLKS